MRTAHYPQLARRVQEQAANLLLQYFRPPDFSPHCSAWTLLTSLIYAAAAALSLAAVAALRRRSPSRETLRQALRQTLPDYDRLRRQLPRLLHASLPRGLRNGRRRRAYPLAIDLHGVPYYKRQRPTPAHVRKGQRLAGTNHSHQYATASLLRKGQYYVVALTPYDPGDDKAALVRRLLRQAAGNGFAPRYVLMDRGFWAAAVFRYLQQAHYPFLIPVLARGKKATTPGGPTGTRVFFHGCKTGWYRYRVTERRERVHATLTILVQRRNWGGRQHRHGRYVWAYGMWRMKISTLAWVHACYRRRFRIESSYRLLETARGRTSSRDEGWRLWYVVLAVVLLNIWLQLRRQATGRGGAGRREEQWWNRLVVALLGRMLRELAEPDQPTAAANPTQRE
jgi:putative transposase